MAQILSLNAITPGPPYNQLFLADGVVTVNLAAPASPTPQVGQLVSLFWTVSVPSYVTVSIARNRFYPKGWVGVDPNFNLQMCVQAGTTQSGTAPTFASTLGVETTDGTCVWICIASGISWNFNGLYHIQSVASASQFTVNAHSFFTYFNPLQTATGAGGYAVIMTMPEPIAELHNINPSPSGILYTTTVAYAAGVYVVTLADDSPILTALWNTLQNSQGLWNPQLYKLYVRLIDTQSYWGCQFNGLYSVLEVLGPNQFAVLPKSTQYIPNDYGGGGLCEILASLSMQTQAGFLDTPDVMLQPGAFATDDSLLELSYSAKFAALRPESQDMGYYRDGDTVPCMLSSTDGYPYSPSECDWEFELASTSPVVANNGALGGGAGVFTPGTPDFPTLGPQTYGNLLIAPYIISIDETGKLTCWQYTDQGTEKMGAVRVVCTAQRQSVPIVLPVAELPLPGTPYVWQGGS